MIGVAGNILILVSFFACALSGIAFYRATVGSEDKWLKIGRHSWFVSLLAASVAISFLMYIIATHQYQYYYPFEYSSNDLPWYYILSSLWAGQEGSFLLWIVFDGLVGVGIIAWVRSYEAPVMAIISLAQIFLILMILGVHWGPVHLGASPFLTLLDKYPDAPMMQVAGFVPADGQGLNDLLQNFWMVIHPPVLFMGYALMMVPFAFAVAGLWRRDFTGWIRPALPWAIVANTALMAGIALGGYWAYVTLSFGGYWAWDPVENASFVPWLVGIGAIHVMISHKRREMNKKASILLNIFAYLLIVYSTFLTRSGILSDSSVHSFTDLGLYNQLLLWMLTLALLGLGLFARHYKALEGQDRSFNLLSREFLIFCGALVLSALGFVILVGTSAPIVGKLFTDDPSAVSTMFYNHWSVPLVTLIAFLAGLGQMFWWKKMRVEDINHALMKPLVLSVICTLIILFATGFLDVVREQYSALAEVASVSGLKEAGLTQSVQSLWGQFGPGMLLLMLVFFSFFAFFGNGQVLWRVGKGNPRMAGGALAHVGIVLMIFGILGSSAFDNTLTDGQKLGKDKPVFVIDEGQTRTIEGYTVTFADKKTTEEGRLAYKLDFTDPSGRAFSLEPVVYKNRRNQWVQHPDIRSFLTRDVYVAVSPGAMFNKGGDENQAELLMSPSDSVMVGEKAFAIQYVSMETGSVQKNAANGQSFSALARLKVTNLKTGIQTEITPAYVVPTEGKPATEAVQLPNEDLSISLMAVQATGQKIKLLVRGKDVVEKDWLVVQAYEKPLINLLWLGLIVMTGGFVLATYRRVKEEQFSNARLAR